MAERAEKPEKKVLSDEELFKRLLSDPEVQARIRETRDLMREGGRRRVVTDEELRHLLLDDP